MGSFLDKPKTEKTNESGSGNNLKYGLSAMQGWRIEMEDAHTSLINLPKEGLEQCSFFAVFDGHAGSGVSKISSTKLLESILNSDKEIFDELVKIYSSSSSSSKSTTTEQNNNNDNKTQKEDTTTNQQIKATTSTDEKENLSSDKTPNSATAENFENSIKNINHNNELNSSINNNNKSNNNEDNNISLTSSSSSFRKCSQWPDYTADHEKRLKETIRKGHLDLDTVIRAAPEFERGDDKSGSTAISCLITPSHVYLINCGDSRAIMVRDNQIVLATYDHKPMNPGERDRIQKAGGSVMIQRVNGSLAVSRALGDFEYKNVEGRGPCEQLVSPEPEIYIIDRDTVRDEFIVLACDGIWDVMSNEELKEYIRGRMRVTSDLVKISSEVLDLCLNKGSRDNMSLIIISFPGAPKVDDEEIAKENSCNEKIETRIKEIIESSDARLELAHVIHALSAEKFDDLPAIGGLYTKYSFIQEVYERLVNNKSDEELKRHYISN